MSLARELELLQRAVRGARILADELSTDQFATEIDQRQAPGATAAILSLVDLRLRDLDRAFRGELDPYYLVAAHNEGDEPVDFDVELSEWTHDQREKQAQAELRRVERLRQQK